MTQANREKILNMLSPRILQRQAKRAAAFAKKPEPKTPEIDNAQVCQSVAAIPNNITVAPPEPLLISPNEGRPAVNGQAEKLDIRPIQKEAIADPGIAAIPQVEKKKPGRPKKSKPEDK